MQEKFSTLHTFLELIDKPLDMTNLLCYTNQRDMINTVRHIDTEREVYMVIMTAETTKLRLIRESLGVSQEAVARRTMLGVRTYMRAESGKTRTRYDTAMQILQAINGLLQETGREPVTLDDLGLKLF